jgi:hypothetical protein
VLSGRFEKALLLDLDLRPHNRLRLQRGLNCIGINLGEVAKRLVYVPPSISGSQASRADHRGALIHCLERASTVSRCLIAALKFLTDRCKRCGIFMRDKYLRPVLSFTSCTLDVSHSLLTLTAWIVCKDYFGNAIPLIRQQFTKQSLWNRNTIEKPPDSQRYCGNRSDSKVVKT